MEYYIFVSNDCNLGCSYCSVIYDTRENNIPLIPNYTFKELESFVTKTQRMLNDKVADIYFFGGEPTMRYDIIEQLIDSFKIPHEYIVNYILHTNGLLLLQAPTKIINELHIAVVSINYEMLFSKNHLTSYLDSITSAITNLKRNKEIPVIGRFTVSENTSLYTECCIFVNYFDYIYWQMDNCTSFKNSPQYINQYKADIVRLFNYWLSFLRIGVFLNFVPFITAISRYLYEIEIPKQYYCGYGYSMIYIQTHGKCYACCDSVKSDIHLIGDIYNGVSFPVINLSHTICGDCQYIKICGGRCGRMHKEFTASHINEYCEMNKAMYFLIEKALPEIETLVIKYPEYKEKINNPIFDYTEFTA